MRSNGEQIGQMLVDMGLLEEAQLEQALARCEETGKSIGQNLIEMGFVHDPSLLLLLVAQGAASPWILDDEPPSAKVMRLLSPSVCNDLQVLPIWCQGDLLLLATAAPGDMKAAERVRVLTGLRIEPVLADGDRIRHHIERNLNSVRENAAPEKSPVETNSGSVPEETTKLILDNEVLSEDDTAPVVGLIDQMISDSIRRDAREIHIEPTAKGYDIRFRIDGDLHSIGDVPASLAPLVAARLKIMAGLDIFESAAPQSGTITIERTGQTVSLRLESLPTPAGERFTMRVQSNAAPYKLEQIGFNEANLERFRQALHRPDGLVVVAGPAGSGITTTLYSALQDLASPARSIVTCEARVEYDLPGVTQTQYGESGGLSCPELLNFVLRHDPDVLMVAELSDEATARATVRAALAGKLVLGAVQSRGALGAIPMLIGMGVDPFLLGASLAGVVAQRQLRTLCPKCRTQSGGEWRAVGCNDCNGSGYSGLVTVHEVLLANRDVASLVARKAPMPEIEAAARESGFRSMREDAMDKVKRGLTDVGEVERVLGRRAGDALPSRPAAEPEKEPSLEIEEVAWESEVRPMLEDAIDSVETAPPPRPAAEPEQAPEPAQRQRMGGESPMPALRLEKARAEEPCEDEDLEAHFHLHAFEPSRDRRNDAA
ncbi:MAG: Flp pilus assembly complex ATPase component TadA [Armatimonadetes bacterium]|nr:Flp pilus assembly complex ATPase component TadA [Armatimonadota bacterium]